jgi:hypothetical protein
VNAIITVLSEELLEVSRGVIEGSLVGGSSEVLPELAESPFFPPQNNMEIQFTFTPTV